MRAYVRRHPNLVWVSGSARAGGGSGGANVGESGGGDNRRDVRPELGLVENLESRDKALRVSFPLIIWTHG